VAGSLWEAKSNFKRFYVKSGSFRGVTEGRDFIELYWDNAQPSNECTPAVFRSMFTETAS